MEINSDIIAFLSFLTSVLSALYARWCWYEARKVNLISLHKYKKEIYDAFFNLKMHMNQKSPFADITEVSKFYYPSINAKVYFPKSLADNIEKYYEACFWISKSNKQGEKSNLKKYEEIKNYIELEMNLSEKIEKELFNEIKNGSSRVLVESGKGWGSSTEIIFFDTCQVADL